LKPKIGMSPIESSRQFVKLLNYQIELHLRVGGKPSDGDQQPVTKLQDRCLNNTDERKLVRVLPMFPPKIDSVKFFWRLKLKLRF
jgi:hypothetical protein